MQFGKAVAATSFIVAVAAAAACSIASSPRVAEPDQWVATARVSGAGPADLILVPGLSGGELAWRDTVRHLQSAHRIHEIRVAGLAGNAGTGPRTIDEWANGLARYVRGSARAPAVVVGHSAGGVAALALAIEHPELVERVVIVDALPFMSANTGSSGVDAALRQKAALEAAEMEAEPASSFAERMHSQASGGVGSQALSHRIALDSVQSHRATYAALSADLMTLDLRVHLMKLQVPVTVIFADQAPHGAPPGHMRRRYERQYEATQARLLEIENARHYVMLDQPAGFLEALDSALECPRLALSDPNCQSVF